jgi:uncharacterized protein (TIGR03435 family)
LAFLSGVRAQLSANAEFVEEHVSRSAPGTLQTFNPNELALETQSSFRATGVTLKELMGWAYPVTYSQITGGPRWIDTTRFDVVVVPKPNTMTRKEAVHRVLKERFSLMAHLETAPVYTLSLVGGQAKLIASDRQAERRLDEAGGKIVGEAVTTRDLAAALSRYLGRPVIDRTRLDGRWDFKLEWPLKRPLSEALVEGAADPLLVEALRSQLGLILSSFPYESLVVDRAELPTED